ncbi:MAG: squalene/phytoene synthase family protein [Polyangia bacterium]|jgi:farnesyl-diphosphate farnesyltransferase|nr:squalene/phytoene synthase family protein [Polyangia bacterium]
MIAEQVNKVSRSFGMVIDQLHEPLRQEVRIAYLLFRLGDNIEDTSSLGAEEKHELLQGLLEAFREGRPYREALERREAGSFRDLTDGERELFAHTDGIIEAFGGLAKEARGALLGEAASMFGGMARMQRVHREGGFVILPDPRALEEYCYYVAGTVGDFLTDRFLAQIPWLDERRRAQLLGARRALALVLQVTNILRDLRDDHEHGHIFYPRSFFDRFDAPALLGPELRPEVLRAGVRVARWLLPAVRLASAYIQALPARSRPMRVFCAIPYAMALGTLTRVVGNQEIFGPEPVKLTRAETRRTVLVARAMAPSNFLLNAWFDRLRAGLEGRLDTLGRTLGEPPGSPSERPSFERFDFGRPE